MKYPLNVIYINISIPRDVGKCCRKSTICTQQRQIKLETNGMD